MEKEEKRYIIKDYQKKPAFSSFLPGISGEKGIPLWSFYVNRGQAMASFGIQDKEHSIMEFYPAYQAYQLTDRLGFRTFIRENGRVFEAFSGKNNEKEMSIGMNDLQIREDLKKQELSVKVTYFTLPEELAGALVRKVQIENKSSKERSLELLDGMAALIPAGISLSGVKEMGQTMQAWMQAEDLERCLPYYRARFSTTDSAAVKKIEEGNFYYSVKEGALLPVIADIKAVFGEDTGFHYPQGLDRGLDELLSGKQVCENQMPCAFTAVKAVLEKGESLCFYSVCGHVESKEDFWTLAEKSQSEGWFDKKLARARELTWELTGGIACHTKNPLFDGYCRQTFLDNVLRGGFPIKLSGDKIFYLYSRKHGDLERDYNFFSMAPEFYSQGNGNFRDVNQNRRSDVRFVPEVKEENIKSFYNDIQLNGYNSLGIEKMTYRILWDGKEESMSPGELYRRLLKKGEKEPEKMWKSLLKAASCENSRDFKEGYWTDHWTYNLDLVESYLSVYPEKERGLLFGERSYGCRCSTADILPRKERYCETEDGIRQYHFLREKEEHKEGFAKNRAGEKLLFTLAEKMFLLCVVKMAALDAYAMGIEMEGGKPGWYDALNGLPGLLGSSMTETCELVRQIQFLKKRMETYKEPIRVPEEVSCLAESISKAVKTHHPETSSGAVLPYWNEVNEAKEAYWKKTENDILSGEEICYTWEEARELLLKYEEVALSGVKKAVEKREDGLCPAYFYYKVTGYEKAGDGICLTEVEQEVLPAFLEGNVRYLKLPLSIEKKADLYQAVRKSGLYDEKLEMYKVNASLKEASYELGRTRAFTPGWLENESVWLHMEYKYLLELLKSGLYEQFFEDFGKMVVPFLKEETYGRSLLENSSFIASSANPNPAVHGRGFVARLSGSTAEFLEMWQIMMFGKNPFTIRDGELALTFAPAIPEYLICEDNTLEAVFLGKIPVTYVFTEKASVYQGSSEIERMELIFPDGIQQNVTGGILRGKIAELVRDGGVEKIKIWMKKI